LFGRAPSIHDVRLALNLWGFLEDAPAELKATRRAAFSGVGHDYVVQRDLVDGIPEASLRLKPEDAKGAAVSG
jgi:hypothetical protein